MASSFWHCFSIKSIVRGGSRTVGHEERGLPDHLYEWSGSPRLLCLGCRNTLHVGCQKATVE